jgi:hypothetical protein
LTNSYIDWGTLWLGRMRGVLVTFCFSSGWRFCGCVQFVKNDHTIIKIETLFLHK